MASYEEQLTQEEFEELHEVVNTGKKPEVKVNREALRHLLTDHANLWELLGVE